MNQHLYIVTGSSRGLGEAMVSQLLLPGHQVLGMARRQNPALDERAAAAQVPLTQWAIDLGEPMPAAERLAQWLADPARGVFASATLVNNAGVVGQPAPLSHVPLAVVSAALRVGLEAAMLLSAAFLAATAGWTGPRRLMNISSGLGRRAMAGSASYCAAKAGMDHFSRAVALEEADQPNGARIVSVAPGVINTDMQAELRGADAKLFPERARFAALHSEGQLMSADDCAMQLLRFLHSPAFGSDPIADIRTL